MVVRVASEAAARIRTRGGRVFLWQEPVGAAFVRDRLAFRRPGERWQFKSFQRAGVEICLAPEVGAREVFVRPRRWPLPGIRVEVNGKDWGRRGEVAGGGG